MGLLLGHLLDSCLDDPRVGIALAALRRISDDAIDRRLLSRALDVPLGARDAQEVIDDEVVADAARQLEIPESEVRGRYEALWERIGGRLKLAWRGDR